MKNKVPETNEHLILEWCKLTLQRFEESIDNNKIGVTENLRSSLVYNIVHGSGGNIALIEIKFAYYGRFVDMGVGRGVPIGGSRTKADYFDFRDSGGRLHAYNRVAKPWYSKKKYREIARLGELLTQFFGLKTVNVFETALSDQVAVKL